MIDCWKEVIGMLDTLIRNARVVDGTGRAVFTADVGLRDGLIEAVGALGGAQAFEIIEADGRVRTRRCFVTPSDGRSFLRGSRRS